MTQQIDDQMSMGDSVGLSGLYGQIGQHTFIEETIIGRGVDLMMFGVVGVHSTDHIVLYSVASDTVIHLDNISDLNAPESWLALYSRWSHTRHRFLVNSSL